MKIFLSLLIVICVSPSLALACPECKSSGKLEMSNDPLRPFVRSVDLVVDKGIEFKKNWFRFDLDIKNTTGQVVTLTGFSAKITHRQKDIALIPFDLKNLTGRTHVTLKQRSSVELGPLIVQKLPDLPRGHFDYVVTIYPTGWYGTFKKPTGPLPADPVHIFATR